jgi:probable HAF family extracellular repeat protein
MNTKLTTIMTYTALAILYCNDAFAASLYSVTHLGSLTPGGVTFARAINSKGQVTGYAQDANFATRAFFYDGAMHDLGTLGGSFSVGNGINADGRIVGYSDTGSEIHAFLYDGSMRDLGTLSSGLSIGSGINADGQIAGTSGQHHAFLYDGKFHDLGTLGGSYSEARGINDSGQITGISGELPTRAFFYDGTMRDLGTLGGNDSFGNAINNSGQVAGYAVTSGDPQHAYYHAFISAPNGGPLTDLGTLGGDFSNGQAINAHGQVVGLSSTGDTSPDGFAVVHAFVYEAGVMFDLNQRLTGLDQDTSLELFDALGINDSGQIIAYGRLDRNGLSLGGQSFLLTPAPVPIQSPAFLLAPALGCLGLIRRRVYQSGRKPRFPGRFTRGGIGA